LAKREREKRKKEKKGKDDSDGWRRMIKCEGLAMPDAQWSYGQSLLFSQRVPRCRAYMYIIPKIRAFHSISIV
jgi:hypothetical protein